MKKKCQICGKSTHEWERVNGGLVRCYPCGKRARMEQEQMQALRNGKPKKLQKIS